MLYSHSAFFLCLQGKSRWLQSVIQSMHDVRIYLFSIQLPYGSLQAGIEFKKNLRVRFGKYGGLKLEYFWVVKSKKAKSFIRG